MNLDDSASKLEHLSAFPSLLRRVTQITPVDLWRQRPADGGFALVEQAWHLADLEHEGFTPRIERLLGEPNPLLADFPGGEIAKQRYYLSLPMAPALERFELARAANVRRFIELLPTDWARRGVQENVGVVTLADVLDSMGAHDLAHANELMALMIELDVTAPAGLARLAQQDPLARSA